MKNDFTIADLTAIHTRRILAAKKDADLAADALKIVKERAKNEGVCPKNVKVTLEFLSESDGEREQRVMAIQRTAQALGFDAQLSFDFVRVADDWDRIKGRGKWAAIKGLACEPPTEIKGHERQLWIDGWTDFMKLWDAYQDTLDEQSDSDRHEAEMALSQERLDQLAEDRSDDETVVTISRVA